MAAGVSDLVAMMVSLLALGVAALAIRTAWKPPVCGTCGLSSEALPGSVVHERPVVLEVVYQCPRCEQIVGRHRFGEWD